jgi:protein-L-isoaspartate(D-aspartate) O-methyltransferase
MVVPVGEPYLTQDLVLVEKDSQGGVHRRSVLPVAFVPLTGAH